MHDMALLYDWLMSETVTFIVAGLWYIMAPIVFGETRLMTFN